MTDTVQCPLRLRHLCAWIPKGTHLIDVGCDHAYLPIYAVQNGIVSKATAVDRNKAPLKLATKNIAEAGLSDRITLLCKEGVHGWSIPPNSTLVMAGMGGSNMRDILSKASLSSFEAIIMQPNKDAHLLRAFLAEKGWGVVVSAVFFNGKRHFLSFKSQFNQGALMSGLWHWHDPYLINHPSQEWINMLKVRTSSLEKVFEKVLLPFDHELREEYNVLKHIL